MATQAVEVSQVSYKVPVGLFGRPKWLLQDISLSLPQGRAMALMGDNGAGKTTLFKSMLGALRPHQGEVRLFGLPAHLPHARAPLGFMPERSPFSPVLRPQEILRHHALFVGMSQGEARAESLRRLADVGLTSAANLATRALSKGMLQRLALAQALVGKPRLLFLDEPMSGLDPQGRMHVRDLLRGLRDAGTTLLFSSHDAADVQLLADKVVLLRAGLVAWQGSAQAFFATHGGAIEIMVAGAVCSTRLQQLLPRCRAATWGTHTLCSVPLQEDADALIDFIRQSGGRVVRVSRRPSGAPQKLEHHA